MWCKTGPDATTVGFLVVLLLCLGYTVLQPQQSRLLLLMRLRGRLSPVPDLIASSVGVYTTPGVGEDIIVLSANYGYSDFVINWLCTSGNVLGLKAIVVAENPELYDLLHAAGVPSIDGRVFNITASTGDYAFDSEGFNTISNMKLKAVQSILKLGLNVLFTDVDIAFKRDPFLYLRRDVDFEFQTDSGHDEFLPGNQPCTGFYYMRANNKTIDLLERSFDVRHNDQFNVAKTLGLMFDAGQATYVPHNSRAPQSGQTLTFRQLPPLSFPSGKVLYSKNFEQRRAAADVPLVTVHANWVVGKKAKRIKLHERGLWKVSQTEVSCAGQPNCYGKVGKHWLQCAMEGERVTLP